MGACFSKQRNKPTQDEVTRQDNFHHVGPSSANFPNAYTPQPQPVNHAKEVNQILISIFVNIGFKKLKY